MKIVIYKEGKPLMASRSMASMEDRAAPACARSATSRSMGSGAEQGLNPETRSTLACVSSASGRRSPPAARSPALGLLLLLLLLKLLLPYEIQKPGSELLHLD